jgi:1-phosphofructokinase
MLDRSLAAGTCVVTGRRRPTDAPDDIYRRLGADLAAAGIATVGDLHGPELDAFLESGRPDWLKVSREDLVEDGRLDEHDDSEEAALAAARPLLGAGARRVVVSRADLPAIAVTEHGAYRVEGPRLQVVDPTGTGDSMTAGLAVALRRDMADHDTLCLAWAAGAANVTRHGLGSGSDGLIQRLAEQATVTLLEEHE